MSHNIRKVRNYWMTAKIDDRKTEVACGPRRKDGGMSLNLYMRDRGDILKALTITANPPDEEGMPTLEIHVKDSVYPITVSTHPI